MPNAARPGFWGRMPVGFRRLASWLNPLHRLGLSRPALGNVSLKRRPRGNSQRGRPPRGRRTMSDGSVREGAPGPASPTGPPGQAAPAADPPGQAAPAADLVATPGVAGSAHPPDDDPPPAANPPHPADSSYWLDLDRSPGSNGTSANGVPADHAAKPAAQGRLGGWLAGSRPLVVILAIAVASALVG